MLHGFRLADPGLAAAGVCSPGTCTSSSRELPSGCAERLAWLYTLLVNKYYFDEFNEKVIAGGSRALGRRSGAAATWRHRRRVVNGSARLVGWLAGVARGLQTGYLYHYAFAMIIGLSALLAWFLWRS